ncbi:glycosyltransferase family 4 protein [Phlebiopsis gigantea 11061_1 CR5-6]|uniref:phosphatidylinositol N-acetylglucosaminyltransferase n=1 Tax=Phlebiopsis gigantea (strain 11061_1 CR5-6) TaxID=745531 RepID=A0A0C3S1W5_PHLG1|nr:glycosyltransferase family 4 protein [Phlebiopsis gigantea 11061_1 CR5-6]
MDRLTIAMVSDFFLPNVGGVESHISMLAANLIKRGHKVIVITHWHPPSRVGVRWLSPGLKVYHIPLRSIASSATLPDFFCFLPYFRTIVLREGIQLVHGHASLSSMAHEAILHAHHLGVRTVFTDHSLFGFDDAASILTNKLLEGALRNVDRTICVSHTGRENTVLRARLLPETTYVIPNSLAPDQFRPRDEGHSVETVTIVVVSRLAYRKGIDLLIAVAPQICKRFPDVSFIIGGDGPKMIDLLQMREKYSLQDRIQLLGSIKPADVRDVLTRGQIFLNTSLTESFGIATLEAACAGLYVVSTRVGGVPEILPLGKTEDFVGIEEQEEGMIMFADPEEDDLVQAISRAIQHVVSGLHSPQKAHDRVKNFYTWHDITERTERVYEDVMSSRPYDFWTRVQRNMSMGPFFGPIFTVIFFVDCLFYAYLEWWLPREDVERSYGRWSFATFGEALACGEAAPCTENIDNPVSAPQEL